MTARQAMGHAARIETTRRRSCRDGRRRAFHLHPNECSPNILPSVLCDELFGQTPLVSRPCGNNDTMIALGIVLLIIGFLTGIAIVWTLGIIALVLGLILFLAGAVGHPFGGRRHWY